MRVIAVKVEPRRAAKKRLPEVLTGEEQQALLAVPNKRYPTGYRNYLLITVMLNTGLRVAETLALKVDDIDRPSGKLQVREGKGGRDRVLWICPKTIDAIETWLTRRPAHSEHLFSTLKGGKMCDRYIRDFIKRYAVKAGIKKDVHPHLLRHTFATDLLSKNGDIRLVQKALGHASITTTTIYTHIVDEQLKSALLTLRA